MIVVINHTDLELDYTEIFGEVVDENPSDIDLKGYMEDDFFLAYNLFEVAIDKAVLIKCHKSKRFDAVDSININI